MFKTELALKPVDGNKWELLSDLVWDDGSISITVPKGFKTDLASIPRLLTPLFPVHGLQTRAAVIHDWLYVHGGHLAEGNFTKSQADKLFRDIMEHLGVGYIKRNLMYAAVVVGGRGAFKE